MKTAEDTAEFIINAESKLRSWTRHAVYGWALFTAANDALHGGPGGNASELAGQYRDEVALITALRVHALFDRDAAVSFQAVKRNLVRPEVRDELVRRYASQGVCCFESDCSEAINKFIENYTIFNVEAFGKLQSFRNLALAHITLNEFESRITYDEVGEFVHLAAILAGNLSMLTSGLNSDHLEYFRKLTDRNRGYWEEAIRLSKDAETRAFGFDPTAADEHEGAVER